MGFGAWRPYVAIVFLYFHQQAPIQHKKGGNIAATGGKVLFFPKMTTASMRVKKAIKLNKAML